MQDLTEFILECATIILQINYVKLNNHFYNQIKGTTMGTVFAAPIYADL